MPSKVVRDPLYNYISIDLHKDRWLLQLLDAPETQRLRRIHQLGVSYLTYPGADHNRLAHSLGVVHLAQQMLDHLDKFSGHSSKIRHGRDPVLAAAMIHDVGHGPFSHLFEPCLETDHEVWTQAVILSQDTKINKILRKQFDPTFPQRVGELIDKNNDNQPAWQKSILSSQLDMDRLDYLRRDSLFTGAGYGHFDWFRLINTAEIHEDEESEGDIAWGEKSLMAIEEFIFSRYYMYTNVYLHKTTRGFERMIEAMWRRAKEFYRDGQEASLVPAIKNFWDAEANASNDLSGKMGHVDRYLAIEEFTVLSQIQIWKDHADRALSDLARRFLERDRFAMIEAPDLKNAIYPDYEGWEEELRELVGRDSAYFPPAMYCLKDLVKAKYHQPYFPEKESDEQSVRNAIRIKVAGNSKPTEASKLLPRLLPLTKEGADLYRYYVPKEIEAKARRLREDWNQRAGG